MPLGGRFTRESLEPTLGFEPRTCCLRNSCSTAELRRRRKRSLASPPDGSPQVTATPGAEGRADDRRARALRWARPIQSLESSEES